MSLFGIIRALLPRHDRREFLVWSVTFAPLCRAAGIGAVPGGRNPRIHDVRHYADGWVMCPAVAFPPTGAAGLVSQSA